MTPVRIRRSLDIERFFVKPDGTVKENKEPRIEPDNILAFEFRLDDERKTFITREVAIREVEGNFAGGEFVNVGKYDKFLDFYLMA